MSRFFIWTSRATARPSHMILSCVDKFHVRRALRRMFEVVLPGYRYLCVFLPYWGRKKVQDVSTTVPFLLKHSLDGQMYVE